MIKDKENAKPMQPAGQGEGNVSSLFSDELPVWYDGSGKVRSGLPDARKRENRR